MIWSGDLLQMIGMHVDIFQKITSRVGGRRSDHFSPIGNGDLIQLISSPEATKDSEQWAFLADWDGDQL
jgi:hypothetical protein